ncbi:hypothetical protein [Intrasporangium sp. YIM S08009]|uniref:hypothetical protein n=1 Tax=Intrasporangium zincisolvens TaxID=3080018 RepID=UPI002B0605C7|nr:hypothetical protein [Intrasporangium sp. YIM S08009]
MKQKRVRNLVAAASVVLAGGAAMATIAAAPASAGVSGPAFYVDHVLYRTVATPTDLSGTGAPESSYDTIYSFGALQRSVATSAPGYRDFNGGRWAVHAVTAPHGYAAAVASGDLDGNGVIDATNEVVAALTAGDLVDTGVVKRFVCTVNRVPASQS